MKKINLKEQELKKLALLSERELYMELRTSVQGLSNEDALERLEEFGPNKVDAEKPTPPWLIFLSAFKDPFVLVLLGLMLVSALTKDYEAAIVMGLMVLASVIITFIQEYRSQQASEALKELIENDILSTCIARVHYLRRKEAIPKDLEGQARYWKQYYNTPKGKGTVEEYIRNYKKYVLKKA